jgi:hypothetical protein
MEVFMLEDYYLKPPRQISAGLVPVTALVATNISVKSKGAVELAVRSGFR